MPIFEYHCKDCGIKFEKIVFNREAPPPVCPHCQGEKVEKLISVPGSVGVASASSGPAPSCSTGSCGGGGFS